MTWSNIGEEVKISQLYQVHTYIIDINVSVFKLETHLHEEGGPQKPASIWLSHAKRPPIYQDLR